MADFLFAELFVQGLNFAVRESVKERFIEGKYRTRKKMVEILEEGLALWEAKNL